MNTSSPQLAATDWSPRTLLLGVLLALCCFYGNLAKDSYMDDFRAFYVASECVHAGLDPYVNHVELDERYADGLWDKADSRYLYPPTALLFFTPLSRVPYKWSKTAFGTLMALSMVAVLWQLHRKYPRQTLVLLALFLTLPMFMNIDNGQIDCAILALTLAAFYLEDGGLAGACLGIAIAVKMAPVLLLLWFASNRRWRTVTWSLITTGALALIAYMRWGGVYFRECLDHLAQHTDLPSMATIPHTFTTMRKIGNTVMFTADGPFSYQHDIGGYLANPLHLLGRAGAPLGWAIMLGVAAFLFATRRGRSLDPTRTFFCFLVAVLFANPLLWTMGLVACFPLTVLLVDESERPNMTALTLLVPLLLTKQLIGNFNFTLWILIAAYWLWRNTPQQKTAMTGSV